MILKSMAKVVAAALFLFGMNGAINFYLMKPLEGESDIINRFRYHLDDAVFILLFLIVAIVFWAMYAVIPRERGYLYLGVISVLTSIQLFSEWDDKVLVFGPIPEIPYLSLGIKTGVAFLIFSFIAYLLNTGIRPLTRGLLWAGGLLWLSIACALFVSMNDFVFVILNRLFLLYVCLSMALSISQLITLLRLKEYRTEIRWICEGFMLFALVLLPDLGKDVLEELAGRKLGYQMVYWEQCLEDTFAWALLALLTVFGVAFFRRFSQTVKENQEVTEELRLKNITLEQEIHTRQRLDQLLSVLIRTYRISDLEQSIIREGHSYFQPNRFVLVKYNEYNGLMSIEGTEDPSSLENGIRDAIQAYGKQFSPEGAIVTSTMVIGVAGGTEDRRLLLTVYSADGSPIVFEERNKFALLLMAKYISIFYEYFQLLEGRLKEMEQRQADQTPWMSKLFMQIAEKERRRLASDLHDEVLQELLHIRRIIDRTPAEHSLNDDKEFIRLGLDNAEFMIRETCSELMPSFLSEHGVLHAVSKLVEKTRLRADFQLDYQVSPLTSTLNDEQTTTIYRVVQELINNAVKHSNATRVELEIECQEGALTIRYQDDGKGMETGIDFASMNRFGLRSITERIRLVGGEVSVTSELGQGIEVLCTMPV